MANNYTDLLVYQTYLYNKSKEIGKMLGKIISNPERWCN